MTTSGPHLNEPLIGAAFGQGLLAAFEGRDSYSVVNERDDGHVDIDSSDYLGVVQDDPHWPWIEPRLGHRVLDIGAGAGRAAAPLQDSGVDVTALDVSPGALEVCRRRGVTRTFQGAVGDLVDKTDTSSYDTLLCMGNNLGLLGTPTAARDFLGALLKVGTRECRLIGTMLNPYETSNPEHLAYHDANRTRGDLPGQVWLRVRYQRLVTSWFGLLWMAPEELAALAHEGGWDLHDTTGGAIYAAELRPTG